MKFRSLLLCSLIGAAGLSASSNTNIGGGNIDLSHLVVVGDSLSAGVQNFSLLGTQQPNGYASVIARQAGVPLTLPLVPFPGAPNVLQLDSFGPPVVISPVTGTLTQPRVDETLQPTNIAVPGLDTSTALTLRPSATPAPGIPQWATIVLGFPSLLNGQAPTEMELAASLKPSAVIEWLGNNDALVPALTGQLSTLTPLGQFATNYKTILDDLQKTGAPVVTATIPDVTEVPYFTSAQSIARQTGIPLTTVTQMLGIGPHDFVRPTAQAFIDAILSGSMQGPVPVNCPVPLSNLGLPTVPCVLTQQDAALVSSTVNCYNLIIVAESALHGDLVVDIHRLVDHIYVAGYKLNNTKTLTADFFGGLFSLDGIHPTNTGYAVIANEFLTTMNAAWRTSIRLANVQEIFATDPLAQYANPLPAASNSRGIISQVCNPLLAAATR